ncbi:MAG: hypothetical protein LBK13_01195 [Spirochaetales bacterium]|jgi:hypothetical protein|nr:hypothetical protein [Spirochaetales bacterium]
MTKKIVLFFMLALMAAPAFGLDFLLRPKGFVFIPAGPGNKTAAGDERFDTGGGGELGLELDFSSIWPNPPGLGYTAGLEGGLLSNPYKEPALGTVQIYSLDGVLGFYYFPLSRLFTRIDGGAGVYQGVIEEGKGEPSLWWRAGGELGFRFTPMFTLAAGGGWRRFQSPSGVFSSGFYAGLTLQITLETGKSGAGEGASATFTQDGGVYPALLSLYQRSPAGTITIQNNENAEIRDVRVSFRAASYTSGEFPCGSLPLIPKGRNAELPLYADFSPQLVRFTDTGRIPGEAVIRYRFLGQEKQAVQTISVQVFHRNVFPQADSAALAAFVSPTSPNILEYAKHITGLARANRRTGLNWNMQAALWLFEGLRAAGLRLDDTHTTAGEAQYPAETLGFKTGNPKDMGLLYAAALEASGIPAALVPLDGDFVVACSLGVNQAGAGSLFNGLERLLILDTQAWLPLSMNAFNKGFLAAWTSGVETLNKVFAEGGETELIMLENARETYPPAPLPAQPATTIRAAGELTGIADSVMRQYISRDIQPQVQNIQQRIRTAPSPALYNRLGILLVRSGQTADAKTAYEQAAGMGSVPAMTNRGNLALIEQDYPAARRWFQQALTRESGNTAALRGLEKAQAYGDAQ